jgi:hypothetical protein
MNKHTLKFLAVLMLVFILAVPAGMAQAAPGNLLNNASFDTDANFNRLPDGWRALSVDMTMDGLTSADAKIGMAMEMHGNGMVKKQLSQTIFFEGSSCDQFRLSVWVAAEDVSGVGFVRAYVQFFNGGTLVDRLNMVMPTGTYGYTRFADTITLDDNFTRIIVHVSFKGMDGTVWFDEASLQYLGGCE